MLPGSAEPLSCCRDPWQPLFNTRLNQKADLTSLDWSGRTVPFGCLVTTDEGALIFVLLEPWDAGGLRVMNLQIWLASQELVDPRPSPQSCLPALLSQLVITLQGRTSASAFLELPSLPTAAVHRPRSAGAPCTVLSVYLFLSRAGRDADVVLECSHAAGAQMRGPSGMSTPRGEAVHLGDGLHMWARMES